MLCRVLEPNMTVVPVHSFMMDAVNGSIEYDLIQQASSRTGKVLQSGPMDAQCPQSSSFGLLRCLGHQHIGGQCLRLINQDTGEELCSSCPTYGASDRAAVGDEDGYLVAMSRAAFSPPKQILPGTNVTIESVYDVSQNHFGVMALFRHKLSWLCLKTSRQASTEARFLGFLPLHCCHAHVWLAFSNFDSTSILSV